MDTKDTTYNGWRNYETWCVNLWLGNDEGSYRYCREMAERCRIEASGHDSVDSGIWSEAEAARFTLADELKDLVEQGNPLDDSPSMYSDLLRSAISEVDWSEIAAGLLEE